MQFVGELLVLVRGADGGTHHIGVVRKLLAQLISLLDELEGARQEQLQAEGLGDERIGTRLDGIQVALGRTHRREQNDGDVARVKVVLELAGQLEAGHSGHQHIADNQVGIVGAGALQTRQTVRSGLDLEVLAHLLFQHCTHIVIILDDKHFAGVERLGGKHQFGLLLFAVLLGRGGRCELLLLQQGVVDDQKILLFVERGIGGQRDREDRAAALVLSEGNRTLVNIDQLVRQMLTHTHAAPREATLHKAFEELVLLLFGDAHTRIRDGDDELFRSFVHLDREADRTAVGGVFEGVGEQIIGDFIQIALVDKHLVGGLRG